ncbi:phosphatase PAP2 family protein [Caproicibacter sp.]|uniref:phosphatase PAP2 family protein n=1 Tax=Caproicibacter sp. TaxID=2814884 RepID=UPI003988A7D9
MKHFASPRDKTQGLIQKYLQPERLLFTAFGILAVAFILWASELLENELSPFDSLIYHNFQTLISPDLTVWIKLLSDSGASYTLGSILAVFWYVSWKRKRVLYYTKIMTVNLLVAAGMNLLFKTFFHRTRPDILVLVHAGGYSFPSGHSMIGAAFYGYLIYLCVIFLKKPWKQLFSVLFMILILFIGLSRIYLGVHYASDVVGGFLAGFAWLAILLSFINRKGAFAREGPK